MPQQPLATPLAVTTDAGASSYIDWPAIIAGAVLATALSLVLLTFGAALGLSATSAETGEGLSLRWITIAGGLWFVWVMVSSNAAGGYLAGRMRRRTGDATEDESDTRDGANGLIVWALGALLGVMLAASSVAGVVRGAATTAGAVAQGAGAAAGGVAGALEGQMDYFAGLVQRGGGGVGTPESRAEVAAVLMRGVGDGEVSPEDRQYLVDLVAAETGTEAAEVEAQVDAALARFDEARAAAVDAVEQARVAAVISAFVVAATLLIAAAAAYLAAVVGGDHRDRNVAFRSMLR